MVKKILISGASYDGLNRNTFLRGYVAEGFVSVMGDENVNIASLDYVEDVIETLNPDVLLLFGSCMPDDIGYYRIRNLCDRFGVLLVFWLHDDPYEFDYNYKIIEIADAIFSNDKWSSIHYEHDNIYHMPLAASKEKHYKPIVDAYERDVFFCGVGFGNRVSLLSDLDCVLKNYKTLILGDNWPKSSASYVQNKRINNALLIDHYASSKFVINIGRCFDYANDKYMLVPSTPGPRTFEAGMAGAIQFYYVESLEIEEYYVDGKEIVLFDSVNDFKQKIECLIDSPEDMLKLRNASQLRTVSDHTYGNRADDILQIINRLVI